MYRLLTKDYVKTIECEGRKILKIEREGLELLAREAYSDVSFYLRAAHLQKLADILKDPEASDNDKFVAHTMLMNQVVSAEGELPTCQDTGTAICIGKKGENVWTGINDAEAISKGVFETYRDRNLRYSQVVPFTMTEEKNTGTNLPAQIDLYATQGNKYEFLFITKGGPVQFPGTGDIFSSIIVGRLKDGDHLRHATRIAMDTLRNWIDINKDDKDKNRGIPIERHLGDL